MIFHSNLRFLLALTIILNHFNIIVAQEEEHQIFETSFMQKLVGISWTNGTDTINFKKLSDSFEDWSDIVSPQMWYLYSVDGPFYVLPCEECYTGNECHMCGYNAVEFGKDSLKLFWEYQNDFYAESEGVNFFSDQKNILSSFIFRSGYFEDYNSELVRWFPINSNHSTMAEIFIKNKQVLEDFEQKKMIERQETEKDIFDY